MLNGLSKSESVSDFRSAMRLLFACVLTCLFMCGCRSRYAWRETLGNDTSAIDQITHRVNRPGPEIHTVALSSAPITVRDRRTLAEMAFRDMSLDEVLHVAMRNSEVLRKLGGTIVQNPGALHTRFSNGLGATDPRFSAEAALSAFDAQLNGSAFFSNNDQLYNCLLYTSPSPRDLSTSRMPSSA